MKTLRRSLWALCLPVILSAGCSLEPYDTPPLTGPSTTALSLSVTATPDILPEDGVSQSVIRIVARDENGQPLRNVQLRIDTVMDSTIVDVGQLSARNVFTNNNGEATVIYTAPRARFRGVDSGTVVSVRVQPVGTGFGGLTPRQVSIRLVPESVVFDPGSPTPSFTFAPASPSPGQEVFFNASASRDDDGFIVSYQWNWGDGETGTGVTEEHDFDRPGQYFVTLTVTDNEGKTSSTTRSVTVSGGS